MKHFGRTHVGNTVPGQTWSPRWYALMAIVLLVAPAVHAQPYPQPQCPAPFTFVRFAGAPSLTATYFPDQRGGQAIAANIKVGLRPGYLYRVKLSGFADLPGVTLFPTIEVRGSLHLPPKLGIAGFPITITFTPEEIERVLTGSLITKAYALEDPDKAVPEATKCDQPLEFELPPGADLAAAARERGRLMIIVRLGEKQVSEEELRCQAILGTVFLPGCRALPPPQSPPTLPYACWQVYDPKLGPKLLHEECLRDGGDEGTPVGLNNQGKLFGLDPADTVAEYADCKGRLRLAISNQVCLCVPRFIVFHNELRPGGYRNIVPVSDTKLVLGQPELQRAIPPLPTKQFEVPDLFTGRKRPSVTFAFVGPQILTGVQILNAQVLEIGPFVLIGTEEVRRLDAVVRLKMLRQMEFAREFSTVVGPRVLEQSVTTAVIGQIKGLNVVANLQPTRELNLTCEEPCLPDQPLVLHKWANCKAAQIGDTVTFYLRYTNHGGKPITNVAVTDSLTGRLEYVEGTAKADRDAVFTTQTNEAGSLILRWEVGGTLQPNASGIVSFQARIR